MSTKEEELLKLLERASHEAGYYRGLLEGVMCQLRHDGEKYVLSEQVFDKAKASHEAAKNMFGR